MCPCPYYTRKRERRGVTRRDMEATAAWILGRGIRALAGIDQIAAPMRN